MTVCWLGCRSVDSKQDRSQLSALLLPNVTKKETDGFPLLVFYLWHFREELHVGLKHLAHVLVEIHSSVVLALLELDPDLLQVEGVARLAVECL